MIPVETAMALLVKQVLSIGKYVSHFSSDREVLAQQGWNRAIPSAGTLKTSLIRIMETAFARARLIYVLSQGTLYESFVPQWYVEQNFNWQASQMKELSMAALEAKVEEFWMPDAPSGVLERFAAVLISPPEGFHLPALKGDVVFKVEKLAADLLTATLIDISKTNKVDSRLAYVRRESVLPVIQFAFDRCRVSARMVEEPLAISEYEKGAMDLDLTLPVFSMLELNDRRQRTATNVEAFDILTGGVDESEEAEGEDVHSSNCVSSEEEDDAEEEDSGWLQDETEESDLEPEEEEEEEPKKPVKRKAEAQVTRKKVAKVAESVDEEEEDEEEEEEEEETEE